jgi:hypothetical protein
MHNTGNTTAFIEAQQYSQFILENLYDGLLPDTFTRDVSDFPTGTTLNIKTVGTATLQDVSEEEPLKYTAIDTGTITLTITDYIGDAWSISDVLRMDGSQIEQLHAMRAQASTRALQEYFETRFLERCNAAQTNANANTINGVGHRLSSAESNNVVSLNHFLVMKLAFDKANAPMNGRVAFVDPVVEATINKLYATAGVAYNPMFEGIINEGFGRDHQFVRNIFGWDVYTSNRLYKGAVSDGTTNITSGVANVFMCVADDGTKPIMRAWRQMPKTETRRNFELKRDEFDVTARFGIGAQRVDTIGILGTSASSY